MDGWPTLVKIGGLLTLQHENVGAPSLAPFVQFHDILSILFRDILYTPARAKRVRERTEGCLSEPWMFENKEFSLW